MSPRRARLIGAAAAIGLLVIGFVWAPTERAAARGRVFSAILGDRTPHDRAARQGFTLAQEALNAAPGATPLSVEFLDPQGSVDTALSHLRALEASGAAVVVDFTDSEVIRGCASHVRGSSLIVLSTDPTPGLSATLCGERLLRVAPWAGGLARDLGEWTRDLRLERVMLVVSDSDQGRLARDAFVRARFGLAGEFILELSDPEAQARWAAERVKERAPQAVVLVGAGWLPVVKTLAELPGDLLLFTDDTQLGPAMRESKAARLLARLHLVEPERPGGAMRDAVDSAWRARFGDGPTPEPVYLAWDALHLAAGATQGETDRERLLLAMRASAFPGASGNVGFESDGERRPTPARRRACTAEGVVVPWTLPAEGER